MSDWYDNPWRPTPHLRWAVPPGTTTKPAELQQLWVRNEIGVHGYVEKLVEEWRPVPTEIVPKAQP